MTSGEARKATRAEVGETLPVCDLSDSPGTGTLLLSKVGGTGVTGPASEGGGGGEDEGAIGSLYEAWNLLTRYIGPRTKVAIRSVNAPEILMSRLE
jgi:hypothetical protein